MFHNSVSGTSNVYLETNNNPNGAPDIGAFYTYTPGNAYYYAMQIQKQYQGSAAGADLIIQGTLTSGTFTAGETITQGTTGATAVLVSTPNPSIEVVMASGTADSSHTWTDGGGAVFTPTAIPSTFHTLMIYDNNCNLVSTQKKVANTSTTSFPGKYLLGRGGDSNASGVNAAIYSDQIRLNYAIGALPACQ
jgi:hypothetical protein